MCGIFGIVYCDGRTRPDEARLRESALTIHHRGPDAVGIHAEEGIGFAHTRLSLVDLDARSNQPLWDETGRYCLTYNGEIYNFRELRESLAQRGVVFHTTSDTEVLLQALIHDDAQTVLARLEGMFAFAFFDRDERRILLARDRFGIKPLHVYRDDDRIIFASEIKAMRPWVTLAPNTNQIIRYLMNYGAPVRNDGFYDRVQIAPSGSYMEFTIGERPQFRQFFRLPEYYDPERANELNALTPARAVDRVDELLNRSVERMLFADAPVGALCSGGVDSSVLMAMATRYHNNLAIFHADVVGPLSEFDAASRLAKHLKLDLLTVKAHDKDFLERLPETLFHYEIPYFGHPHSVPFKMVSELVADNGVKAVLTGEASDECFLGYEYLAYENLWNTWRRTASAVGSLIHRLPVVGHHLVERPSAGESLVPDMLGQFEFSLDETDTRAIYRERMGREPGINIRTADMLANHLRTLLHRNDTMGMSASLEARFPFLDETLVATAINMPARFKLRFSPLVWERDHPFIRDKWVLRQVADRYLPRDLSQRKKRGFNVSAYQRMSVSERIFDGGFVTDLFRLPQREAGHLLAQADRTLSGKLAMIEIWGQLFFGGASLSDLRTRIAQCATIH